MKKNLSTFALLASLAFTNHHNILAMPANAANDETLTIGSDVFTFKTTPVDTFDVEVGGDAAASMTNLIAVVNATSSTTKLRAIQVAGAVLFMSDTTRGTLACSETLAGSGNAWLAATTIGATGVDQIPEIPLVFSRTANAAESTGKLVAFALPFTPTQAVVQVRTSAGVLKAWDGKMTIGTGHVLLNSDGAADIAENDVVTVLATL